MFKTIVSLLSGQASCVCVCVCVYIYIYIYGIQVYSVELLSDIKNGFESLRNETALA